MHSVWINLGQLFISIHEPELAISAAAWQPFRALLERRTAVLNLPFNHREREKNETEK